MPLTQPQLAKFWRAFAAACDYQHIHTAAAKDEYRHRVMREACGIASIKYANRTSDFDALMLRLSVDACDFHNAGYFATALERRFGRMIDVCVRQLMQIQGTTDEDAAAYVAGIMKQAGFHVYTQGADYWLDLSANSLHRLFMMLDTHRRRTLKKLGYAGKMAFAVNVGYERRADASGKEYVLGFIAYNKPAPFKLKIVAA